MRRNFIESYSIEEAFRALCENTEPTSESSDSKYYLVIANELGFDLEFYAKLVNRSELISEIARYIDLDRFDTSTDILMELQEAEFEEAIENLCVAAAGDAYLEDVAILIKNKVGKVISGIDFTLSLIDELQDYEAGSEVIQKLKTQQPFTFTFERDIHDYGDFVVESIVESNFGGQGYKWKDIHTNAGIGKKYGFKENDYVVHHINGDHLCNFDAKNNRTNLALIPKWLHDSFKKANEAEWERLTSDPDIDTSNIEKIGKNEFIIVLPKAKARGSESSVERELITV